MSAAAMDPAEAARGIRDVVLELDPAREDVAIFANFCVRHLDLRVVQRAAAMLLQQAPQRVVVWHFDLLCKTHVWNLACRGRYGPRRVQGPSGRAARVLRRWLGRVQVPVGPRLP